MDPTTHIYGTLKEVGKVKGMGLRPDFASPDGRFRAMRNGHSLIVVDTAEVEPVESLRIARIFTPQTSISIHPDGQRVALRHKRMGRLGIYEASGAVKEIQTETSLRAWNGEPAAAKGRPPQWGFADEFLHYSPDGTRLLLCSHAPDGAAVVMLFDAETLELIDTLTDLRCYSPYARYADHPPDEAPGFVPLATWSESTLQRDRFDHSLFLGVVNGGDSCLGVYALRITADRVEQVDPEGLQTAVFNVDAHRLLGFERLSEDRLLVADSDHRLSSIAWPPDPSATVKSGSVVAKHLRDDGGYGDIGLPFQAPHGVGKELHESGQFTVTDDHVLAGIETEDRYTMALVAFDPVSLEPLGLVGRPKSRVKFTTLQHLGSDLFVGGTFSTVAFFRLERA